MGQVATALPEGTRLAVFDAVTSNTGIVLPIQELVQLCHSRCGVACVTSAGCWLERAAAVGHGYCCGGCNLDLTGICPASLPLCHDSVPGA